MLKKTLEAILTSKESDELISAFDQVGNIIIVRIPDSLLSKKKLIGETLLEQVKSAKSVFYQSSSVEGEFRTRDLEILGNLDADLLLMLKKYFFLQDYHLNEYELQN